MTHQEQINLQDSVLNRTIEILKSHTSVLGIVLTGSYAKGGFDGFSDIDMDVFFRTDKRIGLNQIRQQVEELFPILSHLWVYDEIALILYENGVRLDLNLKNYTSLLSANFHDDKIIYDPDHILEKTKSTTSDKPYPHPRWNPDEFEYLDWYFWMFRQIYCWTKRAAQDTPKSFNKLHLAIDSLNKIRDGIINMRLWINGKWDYLPNIDHPFAQQIENTYPTFTPTSVLEATDVLFYIFKEISPHYSQKRNIPFPEEKVLALERLLKEFEELD